MPVKITRVVSIRWLLVILRIVETCKPKFVRSYGLCLRKCIAAVTEILDKMGEASGRAQKLQTPVTSALKFTNSNHVIYIIVNLPTNKWVQQPWFFALITLSQYFITETHILHSHNGTVIGFLKMGWKNLFVFDLGGVYVQRHCFCCLDFYIHESKQRQGFGKRLFDFMLKVRNQFLRR